MASWLGYSLSALICWGIVGLTQKLTTNRISADSAIIWCTLGSFLSLPWFFAARAIFEYQCRLHRALGLGAGFAARLGEWLLFACLRRGAQASVAIPLTATYPLLTLILAVTFLGERLRALQWLGIVLALTASVLMSLETPAAEQPLGSMENTTTHDSHAAHEPAA